MSGYTMDDYLNAPSGIGPLADEWADKPHRLIYDLVAAYRQVKATADELRSQRNALRLMAVEQWLGLPLTHSIPDDKWGLSPREEGKQQ